MFRRLERGLPRDPTFPADFAALGYFITETGLIRKINNPEEGFQYFISKNPRHNDVHKEAFNQAIQRWILHEVAQLGICRLHLPQLSTKTLREKHVSILCQPPEILQKRKRILIVINDIYQDLGVWSYRYLGRGGGGLVKGTAVGIAAELIKRSVRGHGSSEHQLKSNGSVEHDRWEYQPSFRNNAKKSDFTNGRLPSRSKLASRANEDLEKKFRDPQDAWGMLVLNPGQLLYSHNLGSAISHASWNSLPRPSAVHPPVRKDHDANFVAGNETPEEHIRFVFENVIGNQSIVAPEAELYVIANGTIAAPFVQMLDEKWPIYRDKIKAIALLQPPVEQGDVLDFDLTQFLRIKTRSWETSQAEFDTLVASPDIDDSATINTKLKKMEVNDDETRITDDTTDSSETVMQRKVVCPTYSSGVERWEELILSKPRSSDTEYPNSSETSVRKPKSKKRRENRP